MENDMARHYFISYTIPKTNGYAIGHTLITVEDASLAKICEKIRESNGFENPPIITFIRELDKEEFDMLDGE